MRYLESGLRVILTLLPGIMAVFASACASESLEPTPEGNTPGPGTSEPGPSSPTPVAPGASKTTFVQPEYPAGPYGTKPLSTIANMSFLGWRAPALSGYDSTKFETISLSDFYNPDGRSDVKLIFVNASAVWCGVCRSEFKHVKDSKLYETYRAKGVEFLGTLFEDNDSYPARPRDLENWGAPKLFDIKFPLALDPGFKLGVFFTSDATPLNLLIDARTMKILDVSMGYSANYWPAVDKLLAGM